MLAQWDVKWRAQLGKRAKEPLSSMFGLGGAPPGIGDSRERSRLAELLLGRDHPSEALLELEKIPPDMLADPSLRYLRARVLEADTNTKGAEALLEDPKQWITSFGPCWAIRGRLLAAGGDALAEAAFSEAIAHDPFGVEAACRALPQALSGPSTGPGTGAQGTPLCESARKRAEPDLGRD
jgi:hypothetical protein